MGRFILAIIAFVLAMAVLKMVLIALVIGGLIFRTKETIGLLLIGGIITLINTHPVIGLSLLAAIIIIGIAKAWKSEDPPDDPPAAVLTQQDDPGQT